MVGSPLILPMGTWPLKLLYNCHERDQNENLDENVEAHSEEAPATRYTNFTTPLAANPTPLATPTRDQVVSARRPALHSNIAIYLKGKVHPTTNQQGKSAWTHPPDKKQLKGKIAPLILSLLLKIAPNAPDKLEAQFYNQIGEPLKTAFRSKTTNTSRVIKALERALSDETPCDKVASQLRDAIRAIVSTKKSSPSPVPDETMALSEIAADNHQMADLDVQAYIPKAAAANAAAVAAVAATAALMTDDHASDNYQLTGSSSSPPFAKSGADVDEKDKCTETRSSDEDFEGDSDAEYYGSGNGSGSDTEVVQETQMDSRADLNGTESDDGDGSDRDGVDLS